MQPSVFSSSDQFTLLQFFTHAWLTQVFSLACPSRRSSQNHGGWIPWLSLKYIRLLISCYGFTLIVAVTRHSPNIVNQWDFGLKNSKPRYGNLMIGAKPSSRNPNVIVVSTLADVGGSSNNPMSLWTIIFDSVSLFWSLSGKNEFPRTWLEFWDL